MSCNCVALLKLAHLSLITEGRCLCSIDGDYRDKALMPLGTFPWLSPLLLHLNPWCPLHQTLIHSISGLWETQ